MKKLLFSIAAVFTFSIASAQVLPKQPQQTQPDAAKDVKADDKNKLIKMLMCL